MRQEKYSYSDKSLSMSKIDIRIINSSANKDFKKIYHLYEQIFVLPEEKESFNGFERSFGFNFDSELLKKYGKFQEVWLGMFYNGKVIGAINFSVYIMPLDIREKYKINATKHIIYILVDEKYRKHGIGSKLLKESEKYAREFVKNNIGINKNLKKILIVSFCEDNDLNKMNHMQYLEDNKASKIKPEKRIVWWKEHGYKKIDFSYVQPPLRKNLRPCRVLDLNTNHPGKKISSQIILEHLIRFFELSILKEHNLNDYSYIKEKHDLNRKRQLNLV